MSKTRYMNSPPSKPDSLDIDLQCTMIYQFLFAQRQDCPVLSAVYLNISSHINSFLLSFFLLPNKVFKKIERKGTNNVVPGAESCSKSCSTFITPISYLVFFVSQIREQTVCSGSGLVLWGRYYGCWSSQSDWRHIQVS